MTTRARAMVEVVAGRCRADERVVAALTYGSVPQGLDDDSSDAEFWIFTVDEQADPTYWIGDSDPVLFRVRNEFGTTVAFLPRGFRCEFHVLPVEGIAEVLLWPARSCDPRDMVLLDRTGELTAALSTLPLDPVPESAELVCGRFANWWLLGWNVLQRGEIERALDAFAHLRRHLLWMARLRHDAVTRWLTPSRMFEQDLPQPDVAALAGLAAVPDRLAPAYRDAWDLGARWWAELAGGVPDALAADIERLVHGSPPAGPSAG